MCEELKKLDKWFKLNKLSLNVNKTNYIVFSNTQAKHNFNITINQFSIERVYVTKFLGVMIDSKLSWYNQILHVQNKVSKIIAVLYKVKYILENPVLCTLYTSLILPYLNYCSEIWGNTYESRIKNIVVLQKRAIRIIGNVSKREHSNPIFSEYRLLKFNDIVKLNTCLVIYKAINNHLPERLKKFFEVNNSNTRQRGKFCVTYCRTKLKSFCVSSIGVKLWNNLPDCIKMETSVSKFRLRYKRFLVNMYDP